MAGGYCPEGYWRGDIVRRDIGGGILSEGILTGGYCPVTIMDVSFLIAGAGLCLWATVVSDSEMLSKLIRCTVGGRSGGGGVVDLDVHYTKRVNGGPLVRRYSRCQLSYI